MNNREANLNPHPPNCTCVDCVNKRFARLMNSSKQTPKDSLFLPAYMQTSSKHPGYIHQRVAHHGVRDFSRLIFAFVIILGLIFGTYKLYDANRENIKLGVEGAVQHIRSGVESAVQSGNKAITEATPAIKEAAKQVFTVDTSVETYSQMFNDYRVQNGRSPLVFTDDLNRIAALRLQELYTNFSHSSAGGYNKHLAENINTISSGSLSNVAAFNAWRNSPGHNANMLNPSYKYTGYANSNGYAIQVFTEWPTVNGEPQLPPGYYWP